MLFVVSYIEGSQVFAKRFYNVEFVLQWIAERLQIEGITESSVKMKIHNSVAIARQTNDENSTRFKSNLILTTIPR